MTDRYRPLLEKLNRLKDEAFARADAHSDKGQNALAAEWNTRGTGIGLAIREVEKHNFHVRFGLPNTPCYWERGLDGKTLLTHYRTSCGNAEAFCETAKGMEFVFCPWCGRTIREVE